MRLTRARGVQFERYDGLAQDSKGISRGYGPDIAWVPGPGAGPWPRTKTSTVPSLSWPCCMAY